MLKTLIIYFFGWLFKKLEDKTSLIIRLIVALILALLFYMVTFALLSVFSSLDSSDSVPMIICLLISFLIPILLTVRVLTDANKLYHLNDNVTSNLPVIEKDTDKEERKEESEIIKPITRNDIYIH